MDRSKTLFRWFEEATGIDEVTFRERIYMAAVARCFPGKAKGGGDRRPDRDEIARCRSFVAREAQALSPTLVIPVGGLAIAEVLGESVKLRDVIGSQTRASVFGIDTDVIALPHPSGVSTWHKVEPGRRLLACALALVARHPAIVSIRAMR